MKIEKEKFMIPAVTAIVVKETDGVKYLLLQERWKNNPLEDGLLEIPGGKISEYENIFDSLRREVSLLINKSPEKFYPMHINSIRKYLADNSNFIF